MSPGRGGAEALRRWFVESRPYPLDPFQLEALEHLDAGRSVLVAAPTGSGKTVVAEYAIARAMAERRRAIYTTPLKALSNQKYADLCRAYGSQRVGLLTGDVSRNAGADIVVMTTEVLRNMIYARSGDLASLGYVVLDEVHYLEDRYRGSVWEEIILSAAPDVVLVCLSATVSNARELASWIESVRGPIGTVIEHRRPIELHQLYLLGDRSGEGVEVLETFVDGRPNPMAIALDERARRPARRRPGRGGRPSAPPRSTAALRPRRADVVGRLFEEGLLPAIYFVFSRAGCDDAVRNCLDAGLRLSSPDERREVRARVGAHVAELSEEDLQVLGYRRFLAGLEAGFAPHHAGMVPPLREAVEECFSLALVKVVFATETLALGVNMPARTVVLDSLSKFGGQGHQDLTAGEYLQLTGRAGRRGIDEVGYAAVVFAPQQSFEQVTSLASARPRALRSSFRPTYNMVVNFVRRYDRDETRRLVAKSFAQFQSEVPLTRQLDAVIAILTERRYLEGWELSADGERLAGIYHDCDLAIAEAVGEGLLDGLDAPGLAALCSLFTYESRLHRGGASTLPVRLQRRARSIERLTERLRSAEREHGLPVTRELDDGFMRLAYDWCRGAELREVLAHEQRPSGRSEHPRGRSTGTRPEPVMPAGDFVRNMKQLVDLLRQLAVICGGDHLGRSAHQASERLMRGIVAASSAVPSPESEEEEAEQLTPRSGARAEVGPTVPPPRHALP